MPGITSLQCVVSLLEQWAIPTLLPVAKERGVAVIARECLANGLLVKAPEEIDLKAYCQSEEEATRRAAQLAGYRRDAIARGRPLAGHAIDFVRDQDPVAVTLLGVRTIAQLDALMRASVQ